MDPSSIEARRIRTSLGRKGGLSVFLRRSHDEGIENLGGELSHPFNGRLDIGDDFGEQRADRRIVALGLRTMENVIFQNEPHRQSRVVGEEANGIAFERAGKQNQSDDAEENPNQDQHVVQGRFGPNRIDEPAFEIRRGEHVPILPREEIRPRGDDRLPFLEGLRHGKEPQLQGRIQENVDVVRVVYVSFAPICVEKKRISCEVGSNNL